MCKVRIGKVGLDILTKEKLHTVIREAILSKHKRIILHLNARFVELSSTSDVWLSEYLEKEADHAFCDGAGIQLAARLTMQPVPEKITYNTWFWEFANWCCQRKFTIFLLGGKKGVAEEAKENLKRENPGLEIACHHGFYNKTANHPENIKVIELINEFSPNVLLVCFGMPDQERWIKENSHMVNADVFLTGGGALDYLSGRVKTTPAIFKALYLEWFFRLCQDPKRLWRRYLLGNLIFLKIILSDVLAVPKK